MKKYAVFDGRARRKEYWMFVLFNMIFAIVISFIDIMLIANIIGFNLLSTVYSLALFLPGLSVSIRRLHDLDKSGWWLFISLIPFIGWIWLLILMLTEGTSGSNQYGSDSK